MPNGWHRGMGLAVLCCGGALLMPAPASAGTLSPSSPSLEYGPVAVGGAGSELALTVTNSDSATTIGAPSLTGADASEFAIVDAGADCAGAVLAADGSCTVTVGFHPTATGPREAELVVPSDGTPAELTIPLAGTGVAAELGLAPSPFDFGSVEPGSESPEQAFALGNQGSAAAAIGAVVIAGADQGQFQLGEDTCSATSLGAGGECSVGVVFAPTGTGPKAASLEVPSDAPGPATSVALTGTGAGSPGGGPAAPAPPVAPAALAVARPTNFFTFGKVIKIRGRGTASLSVKVPGPGVLVLGGKGVLARRGPGAALILGGAGTARMVVAAAGRKRATLNHTGRAKVAARVTYTPFGGDPLTKTKKVGLSKRRRWGRVYSPRRTRSAGGGMWTVTGLPWL